MLTGPSNQKCSFCADEKMTDTDTDTDMSLVTDWMEQNKRKMKTPHKKMLANI